MSKERIMVCVTSQKTCERLLEAGAQISKDQEYEMFVLHIAVKDIKVIENKESAEALEYIYDKARNYGASMTVLKSNNVKQTILQYAVDNSITHIIMGQTRLSDEKNSVIFQIKNDLSATETKISVIPLEEA